MADQIQDRELALNISSCCEISRAISNNHHPCFKVVSEQFPHISREDDRQRPEPWVGNLTKGKILFVSSNPSISLDPGNEREDFPSFKTNPEVAADFFVNRFNPQQTPVHATFNHPVEPNFLTRSLDGEYRSGTNKPKQPQATWQRTHKIAMELLGPNCHPHWDYAMTEIVHCKSKGARGVQQASLKCIDKWLKQIINLSSANVVILLGKYVRDFFAIQKLNFDSSFGSDQDKIYKKLTTQSRALRDIKISDFSGSNKLYIFRFHPTHAISPNTFKDMFGANIFAWLQDVTKLIEKVPPNGKELEKQLKSLE